MLSRFCTQCVSLSTVCRMKSGWPIDRERSRVGKITRWWKTTKLPKKQNRSLQDLDYCNAAILNLSLLCSFHDIYKSFFTDFILVILAMLWIWFCNFMDILKILYVGELGGVCTCAWSRRIFENTEKDRKLTPIWMILVFSCEQFRLISSNLQIKEERSL